MFSTPIWLIVVICVAPFVITFAISLVIGLVRAKKKKEEHDHES